MTGPRENRVLALCAAPCLYILSCVMTFITNNPQWLVRAAVANLLVFPASNIIAFWPMNDYQRENAAYSLPEFYLPTLLWYYMMIYWAAVLTRYAKKEKEDRIKKETELLALNESGHVNVYTVQSVNTLL